MPAHKDGTKEFDELTDAEKAKSISAQILNVEAAIDNRVGTINTTRRTEAVNISIANADRLVGR